MYNQQMLCIVTPPYTDVAATLRVPQAALNTLFADVECVHFSSLVWLPPPPPPGGGNPSLMLELAVDDNIEPENLIQMLTAQGFAPLWTLFGEFMPNGSTASPNARSEWLAAFMLEHTDKAAGGFVGPRDRTAAQILHEADLFRAARTELRAVAGPNPAAHERADLALHMQQWLRHTPAYRWATSPAPRSFWRSKWGNVFVKVPAIASIVGFGGIFWAPFAFGLVALAPALILTILMATVLVLVVGLLPVALTLLLALAIIAVSFVISLLVVRPFLGAGRVVAVFVALLALSVMVAWLLSLFARVLAPDIFIRCWFSFVSKVDHFLLYLAGAVLLAFLAVFAILLVVMLIGKILRWAQRISTSDLKRSQQIPEAVDRCEAELALTGNINHMVSLTDVRRPYFIMRPMLRFWLWIIGIIGHVWCTNSKLGKTPGILFGHWHLVENGTRLLFCSNFDSPFGGYLDDFIFGTPMGVNLVWRWTHLLERDAAKPGDPEVTRMRNYPPTRLGICGGCSNELWFKAYARDSMLPHIYRYEAYKCTDASIDRATRLRDALSGPRTTVKDDQIMRALES
jgi:hypothetical protein